MKGTLFDYIIGFSVFTLHTEKDKIPYTLNCITCVSPKNIRIYGEKIYFLCPLRYKNEVKDQLKPLEVQMVIKDYGISVMISSILKRKGVVDSAVLCILLWSLFANVIWSVSVTGNDKISNEAIVDSLNSLGIREGVFIPSLNTKRLVLDFLLENKEISWMHLNINGTDAIAEISERISPPERVDKIKSSNLVAKCDGVIERADVYSGGVEVEKGEVVQKGQLLVSSFFETRKSGELLRRAKGSVYATTYPSYCFMVSKIKNAPKYETAISEYKLRMLSYGIQLPKLKRFDNDKTYKIEKELIKIKLADIIEFPLYIERTKYKEAVYDEIEVSAEEATSLFENEYLLWKRNFPKIYKEEVQMSETDSYYIFEANLESSENIAIEIPYEFNEG